MTTAEALGWVADVFEESPESLTPETPRAGIKMWDSLGMLTLIARLDAECGILLSDDDLQELRSVGDILEVLRRFGKLE